MMSTKFRLLLSALSFILLQTSAIAQVSKSEYELLKDNFKLEKKALVMSALKLTPAQDTAFWPLYNKYEEERTTISKTSWDLTAEYANKYATLTDQESEKMIATSIKVNQDLLKLRDKYLKTISKKVSPRIAARFIQLEDYLYTSLRADFMEMIPFIDELKQ